MSEKNHVVYVYGPFDRVWAEEPPWDFHGLKNTFIYLQTYYEKHWILRIFYRIFWISIFNTCSYGELFTGVSPTILFSNNDNITSYIAFSHDMSSYMAASIAMEINICSRKHLFILLCVTVSSWTSPFVVQAHDDRVHTWCTWLPWISRSVCAIQRPCWRTAWCQ